jgi:hypothetical protein
MLHRAHARSLAARPRRRGRVPALVLRTRVWASSLELDRRLAEGVGPANSPELTLRAKQLTSDRSRRTLSSALTAAVDEAAQAASRPPRLWTSKPPIAATEVLVAAGPLVSLARDLRTITGPHVRGIALVSFLLCDGTASPLYNPRSPATVRELAEWARAALAPP